MPSVSNSSSEKNRRITILDVARRAGLSRSGAAYALKDDPHVSKATRVRVQQIAAEMGYRPDPLLSKLMAHLHGGRAKRHLGKIAFINPDANRDFVRVTPALSAFFEDAGARALSLGYETEMFWLHEPGRSPRRLARMLLARGIRGIVVGDMETRGRLPEFPWEHFAAVTVGYSVVRPILPRVVPHHYRNTVTAVERVLAAGYGRPGLLTLHRQEDAMVRLHVAAFMAFQEELPPENRVRLMNSPVMTPATIRTWFDEQRPDVILTTNYPAKIHLAEAGIRVPRDVALVSLLRWDEEAGIAGVRPGFERLGTVAINQLVSLLQHDERGIPENCTTVELEGHWTNGASMPARKRVREKPRRT
jgi:DNA-binding LacI/PurR family transcriptional regulator